MPNFNGLLMMYSFKKRVIAFFGVVFFALFIVILYLGIYKLIEYFSYPDVVNISFFWGAVFLFFFSPLLMMLFPVIFTGKQITVTSGKKSLKIMFIILGLTAQEMFYFQRDT